MLTLDASGICWWECRDYGMRRDIAESVFTVGRPGNTRLTQQHIISAYKLSPQRNLRGNIKSRENWYLLFNETFDHVYEINL